jgi:branched-chain amino acid transport system permease protein
VLLLQIGIAGLQTGLLYALIGAGFSLIFGTTRIFHAAHGATFIISGYAFIACTRARLPLSIGILTALVCAVVFGVLLNALVYRPIQRDKGSFFTVFVAAFGIVIVVQSAMEFLFGREAQTVSSSLTRSIEVASGLFVAPSFLVIFVVTVVSLGAVAAFLKLTNAGLSLQALSDSPDLVQAFGLNPKKASTLAFALGSALAAPPAILTAMTNGISPAGGAHVMLISLAATIVGGIGSLIGAVIAGLLLGLAENGAIAVFNTQWSEAAGFIVLFAFILLRPSGVFGAGVVR